MSPFFENVKNLLAILENPDEHRQWFLDVQAAPEASRLLVELRKQVGWREENTANYADKTYGESFALRNRVMDELLIIEDKPLLFSCKIAAEELKVELNGPEQHPDYEVITVSVVEAEEQE